MTEADVLLALIMEALEGGPVDVIQVVTDLGFGDLVELARSGVSEEDGEDMTKTQEGVRRAFDRLSDEDPLDEDADPALDDPDADDLDEGEDGDMDALIDSLDGDA